ncbi:MAG TPA: methyltransferase [Rugosimonospora sp.]|nr:methyltransferase [Rugosimonospora sp.]
MSITATPAAPAPAASPGLSGFTALLDVIMSHEKAAYVRAAAELRIADALAGGPLTSTELAARMGFDEPALTRFLRACAVADLVREEETGRFTLTATGALLRSDSPMHAAMVSFAGPRMNRMYEQIGETVRSGEAATKVALGEDFLDYFENISMRADEGVMFGKALAFLAATCGRRIASRFGVAKYPRIVDVGGGHGALLSAMLAGAPQSTGVLVDIPEVIERAREYVATQPAAGRVEFAPGNFFESVPAGGDLYTIKSVLLDWDDEHAARILSSIAAAAKPGTPLLVIDWHYPADPTRDLAEGNLFASRMRLIDFWLLLTAGGKVRSEAQFRGMLAAAGFTVDGVSRVDTGPVSWDVIEARRA